MEEQRLLDELVMRYLNNQATPEELHIFVHLFKQGKLDKTLSRLIDAQIETNTKRK